MLNITIFQLLNIQLNLGHTKKKWLKFFDVYIYGIRNNMIIFNLDFSLINLYKFINYLITITFFRNKLFFISNFLNSLNIGLGQYILKNNKLAGYYDGGFIGGLISNLKVFFYMKKLSKKKNAFNFKRLNLLYPSCVIINDTNRFFLTVKESFLFGIPSITIIDSDLDLMFNFYVLFGNNDSKLISFFFFYICNLAALIGIYNEKIFFFKKFLKKLLFFFQLYIIYLYFKFFWFYFLIFNTFFLIIRLFLFLFIKHFLKYRNQSILKLRKFFILFFFFQLFLFLLFKKFVFSLNFRLYQHVREAYKSKYIISLLTKRRIGVIIKVLKKYFPKDIKRGIISLLKFFNLFFFKENKYLNYFFFNIFYLFFLNIEFDFFKYFHRATFFFVNLRKIYYYCLLFFIKNLFINMSVARISFKYLYKFKNLYPFFFYLKFFYKKKDFYKFKYLKKKYKILYFLLSLKKKKSLIIRLNKLKNFKFYTKKFRFFNKTKKNQFYNKTKKNQFYNKTKNNQFYNKTKNNQFYNKTKKNQFYNKTKNNQFKRWLSG